MSEQTGELLNVYNARGDVVGSAPRAEAKARGAAVGAVQMLVVKDDGRILLQRRQEDKENGGLWDKSVGGHVQAGESFDQALIREANEELFGSAEKDLVGLASDAAGGPPVAQTKPVVARRVRLELGFRDIRHAAAPGRPLFNVTYHAAMYLGRTALGIEGYAKQEEELSDLRYFETAEVDRMLVSGQLAPNMAFLWFALGSEASRP